MNASSQARSLGFGRLASTIIFRPICRKGLVDFPRTLAGASPARGHPRLCGEHPFHGRLAVCSPLEKAKNGTLTFQELWAPHDEHRLLLLASSLLSQCSQPGGDYRVQSFITFSSWRSFRPVCFGSWCASTGAGAASCGHGFLRTSLSSHQSSSTTGSGRCSLPTFLPYTFLALCFCTLYARIPALPKFVLGASFALAGNFSFVQGNLIWPAALPIILFAPEILTKVAQKFCHRVGRPWSSGDDVLLLGTRTQLSGLPTTCMVTRRSSDNEHLAAASRTSCEYDFPHGPFRNRHVRKLHRARIPGRQSCFQLIFGAIVLFLALVGLAIAWRRGLFFHHSAPMGVSPSIHFSDGCLCLRRASMARGLSTANSSLCDIRRILHRFFDRPALFSVFGPSGKLIRYCSGSSE